MWIPGWEPLYDILPVDSVLHESHRPWMAMFVCSASHGRGLYYDVINDPTSDEEVGDKDEEECLRSKWQVWSLMQV